MKIDIEKYEGTLLHYNWDSPIRWMIDTCNIIELLERYENKNIKLNISFFIDKTVKWQKIFYNSK